MDSIFDRRYYIGAYRNIINHENSDLICLLRTEVEAPDYSRLGDDGLPLSMTVELNPKKHFKENAKLCFKQASES